MENTIILDKYKLEKLISESMYSSVYYAKNILKSEIVVVKTNKIPETNVLLNEATIYHYFQSKKIIGFPKIKSYGKDESENYYLVLNKLGLTLSELKETGIIPLHSVLKIGIQLIQRIKNVHEIGIVHRDIKPANIMLDNENKVVHLIDFGFSKKYIDSENNHIPFIEGKNLIGTIEYMSFNVFDGMEYSRRDDMISIFFVLLYVYLDPILFLNVNSSNSRKTMLDKLMHKIPGPIVEYFKLCDNLEFEESPDYDLYIEKFKYVKF